MAGKLLHAWGQVATQQLERRFDEYIECILEQLRMQLPVVLSRVGNNGQKIVIHIQPQAAVVRIELPPEIIEVRKER